MQPRGGVNSHEESRNRGRKTGEGEGAILERSLLILRRKRNEHNNRLQKQKVITENMN
jgi:hypothetical protein